MKVKELIELLSKYDGELDMKMEQDGYWESDLSSMKVEEKEGELWLLD